MTRAGREPAEDLKRRLKEACKEAGMKVDMAMFRLIEDRAARWVLLTASPLKWNRDWPALEIQTVMSTAGIVGDIRVLCQATNDEPISAMLTAPTLRGCRTSLDGLPATLKEIWAERNAVIRMMAEGQKPPFMIRWLWAVPFDETPH